jgi:serine phosphatase RsbU (regulator of sigma subunit)/HAMP domain-containing protein
VVFFITYIQVNNAKSTNQKFLTVDQPSSFAINHLKDELSSTHNYMQKWVADESLPNEPFKIEAIKLLDSNLNFDLIEISELSKNWKDIAGGKEEFAKITEIIQQLISLYNSGVRDVLTDVESYSDDRFFLAQTTFDLEILDLYFQSAQLLDQLVKIRSKIANEQQANNNENFSSLLNLIITIGIIIVLGTLLIAIFTTLSITKPVQRLKVILLELGKGVFPKKETRPGNDEIGEMATAMNSLVKGLKETTQFAHEVGQSNFNYSYQPLSDEDMLGQALLKMKDELAETERILEQKVKERTEEVVKQKDEIDSQRSKLEELYTDVTASIRYAKRLQDSILPPEKLIKKYFPSSFVLFKPKDIVSGDFYWIGKAKNELMFAAVDCTGHGVPGAFMSLVGANGLNSAGKEHKLSDPGLILDDLNKYASETLNKSTDDSVRDGMDITLCSLNKKEMKLKFAGAYNPLYLIRDNELEIIKTSKFAIGSFKPGENNFETFEIDVQKGDKIYIFSDGYADQFGGPRGKKFMYRQFKETLLSTTNESMENQKQLLDKTIESWRGHHEQVDDIVIFGVEVD